MVEGIQEGIEEMNKQVEDLCKELHLPLIGRTHMKPGSLALVNFTELPVNHLWVCIYFEMWCFISYSLKLL